MNVVLLFLARPDKDVKRQISELWANFPDLLNPSPCSETEIYDFDILSSTTLWSLGSMQKQQLQESRLSPATSPGSSWDSEDYLIFSIQRTVSGSPQLYLIIS